MFCLISQDVQFIREASEAAFDETSNRRRRTNYNDEDELASEQEERRRRQKMNKEFKAFADKIGEVVCSLSALPY
jgi:nucleosome binding factor SPN SPT16 subunit